MRLSFLKENLITLFNTQYIIMNQSTDQLYAEYILLASKLDAIRGGRFRAGGYKKHYNELYEKASLLHLELIAR